MSAIRRAFARPPLPPGFHPKSSQSIPTSSVLIPVRSVRLIPTDPDLSETSAIWVSASISRLPDYSITRSQSDPLPLPPVSPNFTQPHPMSPKVLAPFLTRAPQITQDSPSLTQRSGVQRRRRVRWLGHC